MHNFTVKLTVKCVIYSYINCKMRHFYFENFEAKKNRSELSGR